MAPRVLYLQRLAVTTLFPLSAVPVAKKGMAPGPLVRAAAGLDRLAVAAARQLEGPVVILLSRARLRGTV